MFRSPAEPLLLHLIRRFSAASSVGVARVEYELAITRSWNGLETMFELLRVEAS